MIQITGPQLWQWDVGRRISVSGTDATHAHFSNPGDTHAVIMDLENDEAKIPDYLLQNGKSLCVYLTANGITQEGKIFSVSTRAKPENYIYEDDQRNYIYTLVNEAIAAIANANQAAGDLRNAKANGEFDGEDGKSIHFIDDLPHVTPTKIFSLELCDIPNAQIGDLVLFSDTTLGIVIDIKINITGKVICTLKGNDGYTPIRGTDYWTDADKEEIKSYVDKDLAKVVKSVNGTTPDENGNVQIETGGGDSSSHYIVNFWYESRNILCDKTYEEISGAIKEGLVVVASYFDYDEFHYQTSVIREHGPEAFAFEFLTWTAVIDQYGEIYVERGIAQNIGDISTALDHIIALQEELVGS